MPTIKERRARIRYLCQAAMVAALYVLFTWLSVVLGLDSAVPQCRFSEALCVLPLFLPAAVPGLGVGCLIANLLFCTIPDVIFGTLATLLGAFGCRLIGRLWHTYSLPHIIAAVIPNIVSNCMILPLMLRYVLDMPGSLLYFVLMIGAGEVLAGGLLGVILALSIPPHIKRAWMSMQK